MRRLALLAGLALAAGCASGPSLQPVSTPPRVIATAGGVDVQLSDDSGPSEHAVSTDVATAWNALITVYQELGVAANTVDPQNRILGNSKFELRRRLGGEKLSTYLDCGNNLTGNIADNYRVQLTLLSKLEPRTDGGTLVRTRLTASAQSSDGASASWVSCGSTGRLENRVATMLRQRVGG